MTFRSKLELLAAIPHIKDAPKKDDVAETSDEKRLWLETDPTPSKRKRTKYS